MFVSDIITKSLKNEVIKDIFILTGHKAMYLNDTMVKSEINFYAPRNKLMMENLIKFKN
tara:strand:+ start:44665 stop:44841 length:177 start_codon:yes stop_codon:yes gene_type:complete